MHEGNYSGYYSNNSRCAFIKNMLFPYEFLDILIKIPNNESVTVEKIIKNAWEISMKESLIKATFYISKDCWEEKKNLKQDRTLISGKCFIGGIDFTSNPERWKKGISTKDFKVYDSCGYPNKLPN